VQKIKSLEDVVGKRMSTRGFAQWLTGPTLSTLEAAVQFAKTSYELSLLLFKHLDIAFRVNLVLRLFPLAKNADSIISFAATTGTGAVAL